MILKTIKTKDYELIDSGNGEKLERFGEFVFRRPDPEALWEKKLEKKNWDNAEFKFERNGNKTKWIIKNKMPKDWVIELGGFNFSIKPTSFKHIGLFPEQLSNWGWMEKVIKNASILDNFSGPRTKGTGSAPDHKKLSNGSASYNPTSILNLFAYTGGATLACAKAGAEVCHVDSSKMAVFWAKENAKLSGLEDKPIRWMIEDVITFLKREIKRGRRYDGIIMDPPSFGHGPKDELWKIENDFLELMKLCREILSDNPVLFLINGYTAGYSPIAYENNLKFLVEKFGGKIESGELVIEESNSEILLPCGIFARWSKD